MATGKSHLKYYLAMTDIEKLNELNTKIESLTKERDEIEDTIHKSTLAKDRFRFIDYGDTRYWIKIVSINEHDCDAIELCYDTLNKTYRIERGHDVFDWLLSGIPVVEQIFNAKFEEFLNKIKL